jgi:hypothetical protein
MPTRAVQGRRRYARTCHWSRIPMASRALAAFSGGGSWAEPVGKTAHKWIPAEGVRFRASPSWFRLHPLVPGVFWFRARVILLTDNPTPRSQVPYLPRAKLPTETSLTLHPTRPSQRLPVPGKTPPSPHPEPPLLLPRRASHKVLKLRIRADARSFSKLCHRNSITASGRDALPGLRLPLHSNRPSHTTGGQ